MSDNGSPASTPESAPSVQGSRAVRILKLLTEFQIGPILALIAIIVCFALLDLALGEGGFATLRNLRVVTHQAALIGMPALGMTMIIIAGGIDLSAGTALTLSCTALAVAFRDYTVPVDQSGAALGIVGALGLCLLVGVLCGFLNGMIISLTEMVPFIVTLGTMTIFLGLGQIWASESTVYPVPEHLPTWLDNLCYTGKRGTDYFIPGLRIPGSVLLTVVLAIIVAAMMRYTVLGRNIVAVGSNPQTARLCGINVPMTTVLVYAFGRQSVRLITTPFRSIIARPTACRA